MKKEKNYISTIAITISAGVSAYFIWQSFLERTNRYGIESALPLIIPALALGIPIISIVIIMMSRNIKYRKLLANGVKSVGFIKKITETGNYIKKQPEVKFEIDVLEENGNTFLGEVTTVVHFAELQLLKEGEPIPVIYKINNKKEISADTKPDVKKLQDKVAQYKAQNNIE